MEEIVEEVVLDGLDDFGVYLYLVTRAVSKPVARAMEDALTS